MDIYSFTKNSKFLWFYKSLSYLVVTSYKCYSKDLLLLHVGLQVFTV